MKCNRCKKDGFQPSQLNWQVVGYEKDRKQGGTNALRARKRTGKALCDPCLAVVTARRDPQQEQLV